MLKEKILGKINPAAVAEADIGTCHIKEVNQYHRISLFLDPSKYERTSLEPFNYYPIISLLPFSIHFGPHNISAHAWKERERRKTIYGIERNRRNDKTNVQARITQR